MKRRNFWQPSVWALAELSPAQLLAVCPLPLDDVGPCIAQGWGLLQTAEEELYPLDSSLSDPGSTSTTAQDLERDHGDLGIKSLEDPLTR